MKWHKILHIVCAIALISFSCQKKNTDKHSDTYTSGTIKITVDETFRPIIEEEIEVFASLHPRTNIVPIFTSEVEAINNLLNDSVRLAVVTRPLSTNELAILHNKKFFPKAIKLATDGVALITHNTNKDSIIGVGDIRKILTGEVSSWKEIYPSSKLGKFIVVFDNQYSSTVRFAIDSICGQKPLSSNVKAQNTNAEVISYVARTKNAIGIIGVNWLDNRQDTSNLSFKNEVRVMSVSNESIATTTNSYKPFQAYLFYGYYPLTRSVFVILNDPRGALPSGFTSFLTGDRGQRIILKSALVPATQPVRIIHINNE